MQDIVHELTHQKTRSQANLIKMADEALSALSSEEFEVLLLDKAIFDLAPSRIEEISRRLGTIGHHKARGDLEQVARSKVG